MREVAETLRMSNSIHIWRWPRLERQDWLVDQMSKANIPYQDQSDFPGLRWQMASRPLERASPATETSSDPSMTRGNLIGD